LHPYGDHPDLHAFPTRRSSDLGLIASTGFVLGVNYGWNKVRFPAPVPAGSNVRATSEVTEIDDVGGGWFQVVTRFTSRRRRRRSDRKSTRLNSSHDQISFGVYC